MANLFKMADIFIDKIKKDYAEDVAIAAYYGSYAQGTQNSKSDLDIFFIPCTDRGWELCDCFILDDIGIDLFPIGWSRAENIANFNEGIVSVLADCKILYYRSEEDLARFNSLRENIKSLCSPEKKAVMMNKAIEKFNKCFVSLYNIERLKDITSVRVEAFNIVTTVFETLSLLNQTYFKKGWGKNLSQILDFEIKPENIGELVNSIITEESCEKITENCTTLVEEMRNTILQEQKAVVKKYPFKDAFTGYYEEMKSTFNKIITACDNNDYETAFYSSVALQNEIASFLARVEEGICYSKLNTFNEFRKVYDKYILADLLLEFKHDNLSILKKAVADLEVKFVEVLKNNEVEIKEFKTLEEYEKYMKNK